MSKKRKKKRTDTTKVEYNTIRPLLTGLQKGEHKHIEVLEATVINICRAYNITYHDIQLFLKKRGFAGIPKNGKITEAHVLNQLDFDFKKHKAEWDSIHPTRILVGIKADANKDKKIFTIANSNEDYREELKDVHVLKQYEVISRSVEMPTISKNIFTSHKKTVTYLNWQPITSYFTDEQARNICFKMTDSYPRGLAKQIENNGSDLKVIYQLHYIANKALRIFGGEVLSFLYQLRKLRFKNSKALELKTYYKIIPDFPIITLKSNDKVFKVAFFAKKNYSGSVCRDVRIFDKQNVEIGFVDEFGRIESKFEKYKPHLGLFYEITQSGKYELYSGVESGECEVCHRKLDHPLSVRVGIGPTCAVNIGLDRTLYNFSV